MFAYLTPVLSFLAMTLLCVTTPLLAQAQRDLAPQIPVRQILPNAIELQFTPRGLRLFENKLAFVLEGFGIKIDEGFFAGLKYNSPQSYKINDLGLNPETTKLIEMVKTLAMTWLNNFPVQEIRPSFEIGASAYQIQFQRFALITDENLMRTLGKTDGAVLTLEMTVNNLAFGADFIKAADLNNSFLKAGVEDIQASIGSGQTPIRLKIPFYVRVNEEENLEFQTLNVESQFKDVEMAVSFRRLLLPEISLVIKDPEDPSKVSTFTVNNKQFESELNKAMPRLLEQLRNLLDKLAKEDLPKIINEKVQKALNNQDEEINRIKPPGGPGSEAQPFFWGLRPKKINLNKNLNVQLSAYVEDPLFTETPLLKDSLARGAADLRELPPETYDLAMSVDRGFVNRLLQLSFQRGYFSTIPLNDGKVLSLTEEPVVDFSSLSDPKEDDETFVNIKTKLKVPAGSVQGWSQWFVKDQFEIHLSLTAKLKKAPGGPGVQAFLYAIDENSIELDEKYLSFLGSLFKSSVIKNIKEDLAVTSKKLKISPVRLGSENIPLPPTIIGVNLLINKMMMDPQGHLNLYLSYPEKQ